MPPQPSIERSDWYTQVYASPSISPFTVSSLNSGFVAQLGNDQFTAGPMNRRQRSTCSFTWRIFFVSADSSSSSSAYALLCIIVSFIQLSYHCILIREAQYLSQ